MRLLIVQGVALSFVLGLVTLEVVHGFSSHYKNGIVSDLSEEISEYAHAASLRPQGQTIETFTRTYLETRGLPSGHLDIVGLSGHPALASAGARSLGETPTVAQWLAQPPPGSQIRTVRDGANTYLALASPIRTPSGAVIGVLVAAAGLAPLQAQRSQVLLLAASEAAVALMVALVSSYLVLRRLLVAVDTVTRAAVQASVEDLDTRLGGNARDEVGQLATAFDGMLERLSGAFEAQRRLLSDVSHQLRTPLTVARGHLEVLERSASPELYEVRETTSTVIGVLTSMTSLVDRLLLLSRSFSPDFIDAQPVDLRSLMAEIFDAARVLAERTWSLAPVPDLVLMVDEEKLRGVLLNLVDNAVKATETADLIELAVRHDSEVVFSVSDTGTGIAEDARPGVFDRFRQAGPQSLQGAGLGLAIVKAVAEAHGGRVHLDSTEGEGTTICIVLPASCVRRRDLDDDGLSDDHRREANSRGGGDQ